MNRTATILGGFAMAAALSLSIAAQALELKMLSSWTPNNKSSWGTEQMFMTMVAAGRPSTTSMTCAAAYNFVTQRGAVVIGTGGDTFDRAVAHQGFCERGEVTVPLYAPTLDKRTCFIGRTCIENRER